MKITKKWLLQHEACCSKEDMEKAEKIGDYKEICNVLLEEDRPKDAFWLLTELMNKKQCVEFAVFCAEKVLFIFEKEHPNDKRPFKAIELTKKRLSGGNISSVDLCAASAAYAAARTAYAAANAASAAANAAAAYAAASAAASAAYAAGGAYDSKISRLLVEQGISIIENK